MEVESQVCSPAFEREVSSTLDERSEKREKTSTNHHSSVPIRMHSPSILEVESERVSLHVLSPPSSFDPTLSIRRDPTSDSVVGALEVVWVSSEADRAKER